MSGSLVALVALGLAGCSTSTSTARKASSEPSTTSVAKPSVKKATTKKAESTTSESKKATTFSVVAPSTNKKTTTFSVKAPVASISQASATYSAKQVQAFAKASSANTQASYASEDHEGNVLLQFLKASGLPENSTTQYTISDFDGQGVYQIAVRSTAANPDQARLTGLYRFNTANNSVTQMNPVTGDYEELNK